MAYELNNHNTTDTKYCICPKCGKDTLEYYGVQLNESYRPCGEVYQCTICKTQLAIGYKLNNDTDQIKAIKKAFTKARWYWYGLELDARQATLFQRGVDELERVINTESIKTELTNKKSICKFCGGHNGNHLSECPVGWGNG